MKTYLTLDIQYKVLEYIMNANTQTCPQEHKKKITPKNEQELRLLAMSSLQKEAANNAVSLNQVQGN